MSRLIKIHVDDDNWLFNDDVSIRLIKCGSENCLSNKTEESGDRVYFSLHFVKRGEGYLLSNGEKTRVKEGGIFLIRAKEDIRYVPDKIDPWSFIWADFVGENLTALLEQAGFHETCHAIHTKNKELGRWFQQMLDAYMDGGVLFESAAILVRILARLVEENVGIYTRPLNRIVREAIIFINNNYRTEISLEVIARSVGVSPNYLIAQFSAEIKLPPMKYLTMFRIANACALLREKRYSIKQISQMVGFHDQLYFSRCFSELKNYPPKEYIKQCGDDDPWEFIKSANIDLDDRRRRFI